MNVTVYLVLTGLFFDYTATFYIILHITTPSVMIIRVVCFEMLSSSFRKAKVIILNKVVSYTIVESVKNLSLNQDKKYTQEKNMFSGSFYGGYVM